MITNSKTTRYAHLRRLLLLPIAAMVLVLFSNTITKAQTDPKHKVYPVKIQKIVAVKINDDSVAMVKLQYTSSDGSLFTLTIPLKYVVNGISTDAVQPNEDNNPTTRVRGE